ncbi:MAG TPA: ACP S-malonyltransferase [Candidatus Fermentibacter sp.]|nr:ACP S-malonyltransferase [Candidatus Fermentibacter sp.]
MAKTAFLFPGQGSQSVGMASHLAGRPAAESLLARLDELASAPGLLSLVNEGPEELLTRTDNVQPAITAVSLAILAVLEEAGVEESAAAGNSLGEYPALVAAGVLSPGDALSLTRIRGVLMQQCADRHPGGMAALIGATREMADAAVAAAQESGPIGIANINSEGQIVLSGSTAAVEAASLAARASGVRRVIPLKVSGAWHSPLMREAAEGLARALDRVPFGDPAIPVMANVTADFTGSGAEARSLLIGQVTSPVLWAASMRRLVGQGYDTFVEVGPGSVLQGLMKGFEGIRLFGTSTAESLEETIGVLSGA